MRRASFHLFWLSIALVTVPAPGLMARGDRVLRPPALIRLRPGRRAVPLPSWDALLFARLEAGDLSRLPRLVRFPGGRSRYIYRRRPGDPPLSAEQIQALLRNPPTYRRERHRIRQLLARLRQLGVNVELTSPRQRGAAGEWEPRRAALRIRPTVANAGSETFARVLNHEAIHVAQSCRAGGLSRAPALLGLRRRLDPEGKRMMASPLYAGAPARIRAVEEEAYANQNDLSMGIAMLTVHCRGGSPSPGRLGR